MQYIIEHRAPCSVIAFGAHPDDVELFTGATIASLAKQDIPVLIVDSSLSEYSSNGTVEQRLEEACLSAEILGASGRINLEIPDCQFHKHEEQLILEVVKVLRTHKPKWLIGPGKTCRHPDHQSLSTCLERAVHLCSLSKFNTQQDTCSRPKTLHMLDERSIEPDIIIDVSDTWELKLKSLHAYQSQFSFSPNKTKTQLNQNFLEFIDNRDRGFGLQIGCEYGEGFSYPGALPIANPLKLFSD